MAAKRFFDESGSDPDPQNEKRRRTKPSLASAIEEVVKMNFLQNFCSVLEPMLRRVVNEEVELGLRRGARSFSRSSSLRIQGIEPSSLQLKFAKKLSLPVFTGSRILDIDGNPLELILVDTQGNQMISSTISDHPIKIEIVVLDGDFPSGDGDVWTSREFEKNIVRERKGKRPLLTGDVNVTMRDGFAAIGDLEFTDNSSWIRSRKFRVAAKVIEGTTQRVKIREAMTEALVVKDHRGELYKKHHPPMLEDEVWRLEKIGKEGAFHRKLATEGIKNVQDFLKLSIVNQSKLRRILGVGMSEKMWEVTLKHARTCVLGSKLYISRGPNHTIVLNPICQVIKAVVNGQTYTHRDLTSMNMAYIQNLVEDAFQNWNSLEEVDGLLNDTPQITQGHLVDEYPTHHPMGIRSYQDHAFPSFESSEVAFMSNNEHVGIVGSTCIYVPVEAADTYNNFSESSSDGDLVPTRSFIH